MERKKTRRENVSLPVGLLREVDNAITQSNIFTSRARFVEEGVKNLLYKILNLGLTKHLIKTEKKALSKIKK